MCASIQRMSTATDMRDAYIQAELEIVQNGQTNRIGERLLTTADLAMVRAGRKEWERRVAQEDRAASGRGRLGYSVGRFDC